MEYSLLSQINTARHNWCIKVRVARMWQVSGTSKGRNFASMELVLVDEEVHLMAHCREMELRDLRSWFLL
jgi:hypothetical protein